MALFRDDYLKNELEPISAQKRVEERSTGLRDALVLAGTVFGFVLARRKIALTRSISQELKVLGKAAQSYKKYTIQRVTEATRMWPRRWPSTWMKWGEELAKPLPTAQEQLNIALRSYQRFGRAKALPDITSIAGQELKGWTRLHTLWRGPAAAHIAPKAPIGIRGVEVGERGGIAVGGTLYEFGKSGRQIKQIRDVEIGLTTFEARLELLRSGRLEQRLPKNLRGFIETTRVPAGRVMEEERRLALLKYARESNIAIDESLELKKLISKFNQLRSDRPDLANVLAPSGLFRKEAGAIQKSYQDTLRTLVERELKSPTTHAAYRAYRLQVNLGIGEPYARGAAGVIQRIERSTREFAGIGVRHPVSGRLLPIGARRYIPLGETIGGMRGRIPAPFFLRPRMGAAKRSAMHILEGTFFGVPEEIMGIGVTARGTALSRFITRTIGAEQASYGGYFWNRYIGGMQRVLGVGFGAYYSFKFLNYLARQATGGWGVTDVAGKMYTSSREFQQNLLNQVGLITAAQKAEKAFPGLIKSPAAYVARATAPLWMALFGKKMAGFRGSRIGLALGIATALITWGDITQTPEELHRIFSGEQDIPIRKGRYWPFGRTPLGGARPMYWRPHWYPLLRGKYKYQGQLWESETEEMAQGTFLSPILAPLLTGRMWDPYYWERKHYEDRPYPLTGELFEPTMPFAYLANLTIGNIIKPQRVMHPEYWGVPQEETPERGMVPGAAAALGMQPLAPEGMLPFVSPGDVSWQSTMALYTLAEQMGLRGFMLNTFIEQLTGRPDFLPEGPVVQTARRATGYEREYWDLNIGDPAGFTEFFRRLLPHRRRQIEEWNPIRNLMPEWMPGSEYYIDFRTGDPYTKIEMGEARLPGAGYEALHRLHSGIPGVYDAVDRFMILSDVAPYSDQYKQYKALARMMVRGDKGWSEEIRRHIRQRSATQREYEFLELEPPEDITGPLATASVMYRHGIAAFTNAASMAEVLPLAPVSKLFPYKTAMGTYKDYRIYGSEFTSWGHPIRDFIAPWVRKIRGRSADLFGEEYIPDEEARRREYGDYFDRLKYVKNLRLADLARIQGREDIATQYEGLAGKTMTGLNIYGSWANIYTAMPKRERSFFDAFVHARREDREEILDMVPEPMQKLYKAQWSIVDRKAGLARMYRTEDTQARDLVDYYKQHYLPESSWVGWHPDVNLRDVQIKVVKNEGMDIHGFNLWQSQERQMRRRPFVPTIENIHTPTPDLSALQNLLQEQLETEGFRNTRVYINRTPAARSSARIKFKIKRNRRRQYDNSMRSTIYA